MRGGLILNFHANTGNPPKNDAKSILILKNKASDEAATTRKTADSGKTPGAHLSCVKEAMQKPSGFTASKKSGVV